MYLQNKYTSWYFAIINRAKDRSLSPEAYTEKHHILPRSLGGEDSSSNLVVLTAKEHLICHLLLPRMTENDSKRKMIFAARCMCLMNRPGQQRVQITGRLYETIRKEHSEAMSVLRTGSKHTLERNENISKAKTGKKLGPQTGTHKANNALAQPFFGKKRGSPSDEHKMKTLAGIKRSSTTCEHCGITVSLGNYTRWHGDNCKQLR